MTFKKGDSRINRNGRPLGSVGKLTLAREIILDIFSENKSLFESHCRELARNDIGSFYKEFVYPVMPKIQSIEIEQTTNINNLKQILDDLEEK